MPLKPIHTAHVLLGRPFTTTGLLARQSPMTLDLVRGLPVAVALPAGVLIHPYQMSPQAA